MSFLTILINCSTDYLLRILCLRLQNINMARHCNQFTTQVNTVIF